MKSDLREQQKKEFVKQLCHMETLENVHNTLKEDFVKSSSLAKQKLSEANSHIHKPPKQAVDFEAESPANFDRIAGGGTGTPGQFFLNVRKATGFSARSEQVTDAPKETPPEASSSSSRRMIPPQFES